MSFRVWLSVSITTLACLNAQDSPSIVQPGAPNQPTKVLSAAEARIPVRPPTQADITFMQHMIVHHAQAVEMVDLLLARGANKSLQSLGKRISLSQADEIEMMRQWLRDHKQSTEMSTAMQMDHSHMHHHSHGAAPTKQADPGDIPVMNGMLSPNQMKVLAKSSGRRFDYLFLTGMIQHHTGALDMVSDLLAAGGAEQDPQLFDFITDIDNSQRVEIKIMQNMLSAQFPKSSPKE